MNKVKANFVPANRPAKKAIMAEPTPVLSMSDSSVPAPALNAKLSHADAKMLAFKRGSKAALNKAIKTDSGISA